MNTPQSMTPVRALDAEVRNGYRVLSMVSSTYRDGAEDDLIQVLEDVEDLSSTSDELGAIPETWPVQYHLDSRRGNVLRAFDLPAGAHVLEVGAGCGAISRYLGERCEIVDSIEPVESRASVAASRTRDLENVQVFVGELSDIPEAAVYDVVVVIGVLEYVGGGSSDDKPYISFLRQLRHRLKADGSLILAIENPLGVKYLAGAPEDHTGRFFDSIEDYVSPGPARTFVRRRLVELLREAGFSSAQVLAAFPDYKMMETVFDSEKLNDSKDLLRQLPSFPSPDWTHPRPRIGDEARIWRTITEAGLAHEFSNSFIVVAGNGSSSEIWPPERRAVSFRSERNAAAIERWEITAEDSKLSLLTRSLSEPEIIHRSSAFVGTTLAEKMVVEGSDTSGLIKHWLALVDAENDAGRDYPLDLLPSSVILDPSGPRWGLVGVRRAPISRNEVLMRGLLLLARTLARTSPAIRWPGVSTVADLARELMSLVDGANDDGWIDTAISLHVRLEVSYRLRPARFVNDDDWIAHEIMQFAAEMKILLIDMPLGDRVPELSASLSEILGMPIGSQRELSELKNVQQELAAEVTSLKAELDALRQTKTVRLRDKAARIVRYRNSGRP